MVNKQASSKNVLYIFAALVVLSAVIYFVSAAPTIAGIGSTNNSDILYSPYDIINFSISVLNDTGVASNQGILGVFANLSAINSSSCGGTGLFNLTYVAGGVWSGNCSADTFVNRSTTTPVSGSISFFAENSTGFNETTVATPITIIMHNLGVSNMSANCMKFGPQTTNFSSPGVNKMGLNFNSVNFAVDILVNLTCSSGGVFNYSGNEWSQAGLVNLTSVNITTQAQAALFQQMNNAISVNISGPRVFSNSRVYINTTFFASLDSNATITLYGVPFASSPNISADTPTHLNSTYIVWAANGYDSAIGSPSGNISFAVLGFSGYNATDLIAPIINITVPRINISNGTNVYVNISVNGTGSEPSYIFLNFSGANFTYNATSGVNSARCNNLTDNREEFQCSFFINLTDGTKNLTVNALDFGGNNLMGNSNTSQAIFILDTINPNISVAFPSADSQKFNYGVNINYTVSDTNLRACWWTNNSGTLNHTITCGVNITGQTWLQGVNNITVYANDSLGHINSSARNFTIDTIYPDISMAYPQNTSYRINVTRLNYTVSDLNLQACWYSLNSGQANTTINCGENVTGLTSTEGSNTWIVYGNDSYGNINSSSITFFKDTIYPNYSNPTVNANTYAPGKNYSINITSSDTTGTINAILLEFNTTTNYTMTFLSGTTYNASVYNLRAGEFSYRFIINDTSGNINNTAFYNYTVNQSTSTINLFINNTQISLADVSANSNNTLINATIINASAGNATIKLYANGTLFNASNGLIAIFTYVNFSVPGQYNVSAFYSGNMNYTSSSSTLYYNVLSTVGASVNQTVMALNSTQTQVVVTNTSLLMNVSIPVSAYSNQSVSLDLSSVLSGGNVTLANNTLILLRMANSSTSINYTIIIPAGTVVSGGSSWDGKINLPVVNDTQSSFAAPASGTTNLVISLGSGVPLNLSNATRILLGGMGGKKAAWSSGSTTLTNIAVQCNSATSPTNIDSSNSTSRECYIDSGSDLLIWTYHFTSYAAYTPAVAAAAASSSSGGGGSVTSATNDELVSGYRKVFTIGDVVKFTINNVTHQVILQNTRPGSNSAIILVQSTSQQATISAGDTRKFTVNGDPNYYDLAVTVNNVTRLTADITLDKIHDLVSEASQPSQPSTNETTTPTTPAQAIVQAAQGLSWQIWTAIVVVIAAIVVIVLYLVRKKK